MSVELKTCRHCHGTGLYSNGSVCGDCDTAFLNRLRSGAPCNETWHQLAARTNRERTKAADRIAELEAALANAQEALNKVVGCFDAAEVEGLNQVLIDSPDERLKDLVLRRLMYALYAAQGAQRETAEQPDTAGGHTLICAKCGADRFKEDCKGNRAACGIRGEAGSAEQTKGEA